MLDTNSLEKLSEGGSETAGSIAPNFMWEAHSVRPFHDRIESFLGCLVLGGLCPDQATHSVLHHQHVLFLVSAKVNTYLFPWGKHRQTFWDDLNSFVMV